METEKRRVQLNLWLASHLAKDINKKLTHDDRCELLSIALDSVLSQIIPFDRIFISYSSALPITKLLEDKFDKLKASFPNDKVIILYQPEKKSQFEHYELIRKNFKDVQDKTTSSDVNYICFLDDDDILGKRRVQQFHQYLDRERSAIERVAVSPRTLFNTPFVTNLANPLVPLESPTNEYVNKIAIAKYNKTIFHTEDIADYNVGSSPKINSDPKADLTVYRAWNMLEYCTMIISVWMFDEAMDIAKSTGDTTVSEKCFDMVFAAALPINVDGGPDAKFNATQNDVNLVEMRSEYINYYYRHYHFRKPGDSLVSVILPEEFSSEN